MDSKRYYALCGKRHGSFKWITFGILTACILAIAVVIADFAHKLIPALLLFVVGLLCAGLIAAFSLFLVYDAT